MLRPTPMQQLNPLKAAFSTGITPYLCSARFFIPPPDSRAAIIQPKLQHAVNAVVINRSLGLLKPHLCKPSTYFQRKTDTARAVAQPQQAGTLRRLHPTLRLVDHANYGVMLRDICRISPVYCSGRILSPFDLSAFGSKFMFGRRLCQS